MLPGINYPPANLAKMIKECGEVGRKDLGQAIMDQWNKVTVKYPEVHMSWGTATNIGTRSVKKNVFGGIEFSEWLNAAAGAAQAKPAKKAKAKKAA
jgi:hypothetical protein